MSIRSESSAEAPIDGLTRAIVIVASAGLTMISGLLLYTISKLPHQGVVEYLTAGFSGLCCLLPGVLAWWRPRWTEACGMALAIVVGFGLLVRITRVMYGPIFDDPGIGVFMPVFGFVPLVFMLIALLGSVHMSRWTNGLLWVGIVAVCMPRLWPLLGTEQVARIGALQLTYFLLIGLPVSLAVLELLQRLRSNLRHERELSQALASAREQRDLAVRGSGVGLWQRASHLDGRMWWSDRMYSLLERSAEDCPADADRLRALCHPADAAVFEVLEALEEDVAFNHATRLRMPDGNYRWFELKGESVATPDGGLRLAGALVDIHQQKQSEQALHEARQLLDSIVQNAPTAIYAKDRDSRYLMVNPTWCRLMGVDDPGRAIGKTDAAFLSEALSAHYHAEDAQVMDSGETLTVDDTVEIDGVDRSFLNIKFPLRDLRGEASGVVGIALDVTEMRQAHDGLQALNEELEQFIYIVSHDLNSPLRAIRGFGDLFQARFGDQLPEGSEMYLEQMLKGADTMRDMLGAMLDLSRATRNPQGARWVGLDELLVAALSRLDAVLVEVPVSICIGHMPKIFGEANQLIEVVERLLHNAIKYRRPDVPLRVHFEGMVRQLGAQVAFRVRDNGIGFRADQADRVFRVYQKLNPDSRYPGLGMGLAIAEKIVRAHGGRITAEAVPDEGASFTVEIPVPAEAS